jgi:hypothetical protein
MQRNAALADEVRRTLVDLDEIEGQLKKAGAAVAKAQAMAVKYQSRLLGLCDSAATSAETSESKPAGPGR